MRSLLVFAPLVFALTAAVPSTKLLLHERRDNAPSGFIFRGHSSPEAVVELDIMLRPNNFEGLEKELHEISTPGSARYGERLTREQSYAYTRPHSQAYDEVDEWLRSHNVHDIIHKSYSITVKTTVRVANMMLDAEFADYEHAAMREPVRRALAYSTPKHLKRHISYVDMATAFPEVHERAPVLAVSPQSGLDARALPSACPGSNKYATPACLQALYGIPTTPAKDKSDFIGIGGLNPATTFINKTDIAEYLSTYRPDIPAGTTFNFVGFGGANNSDKFPGSSEVTMDTSNILGLATGINVTFYKIQTTGSQYTGLFNSLHDLPDDQRPRILSLSYGAGEADSTPDAVTRVCQAAAQLAAVGTIIFVASGDSGVSRDCNKWAPAYPASCDHVVAVGSTNLTSPEVGSTFTTGGFSTVTKRPSYQDTTINAYLTKLGSKYSGLYSPEGRGIPDVSAVGYTSYFLNGQIKYNAGTSDSTPIMAATFALLNDERLAAGKGPLPGWLGPTLYNSLSTSFNDITSGNNGKTCSQGFDATSGWDPVTGLGTPNYAKLRKALVG